MRKIYIVQPGDVLSKIVALECPGTSYLQVARANGIANPDLIYVGQEIILDCVPEVIVTPNNQPRQTGPGEVHLDVPYYSQEDQTALKSTTDCGPTSVRMVIGWARNSRNILDTKAPTVDDIWDNLRTPGGYPLSSETMVSAGALKRVSPQYGLNLRIVDDATTDVIQAEIDAGRPAIMLCHYGSFKGSMSTFRGGHFLVVVGYSSTHVIVNDPLWWGEKRSFGAGRYIMRRDFEAAIGWDAALDGNPQHYGLFVESINMA